jgi:hypothetical protein
MIIAIAINNVDAKDKFSNTGFHGAIILSYMNLEKKSILIKKTKNMIANKETMSIILSVTTVPNNELTGILFVLCNAAQRAISPILGTARFAIYPITTAL